jgi:nitroreductase
MSTSEHEHADFLALDPDQLLTTTRAVRRRLDLRRPVDPTLIEECIGIGLQAPNASNLQEWGFVVVTDPERRIALAKLYRRAAAGYYDDADPVRNHRLGSGRHLAEHLHEVPVLVIPCIRGRTDGADIYEQASQWASIIPATWSFMLAARARGLGTVWTTWHLNYEREASQILGIPYSEVMQVALIPVAHTIGTDFRPARRKSVEGVVRWNEWGAPA